MLNTLSGRLSDVLQKMKGWGSLNEKNIREGLREIKLALLEADVNYKVVKEFIDGATTEEIALSENASHEAIRSKLARARRAFRRLFERTSQGTAK